MTANLNLYKTTIKLCCWLLASTLLVSCANRTPIKVDLNSQQHQHSLAKLQHWQIKGKLGFKSPKEKQSANLSWLQDSHDYRLSLNTILGTSILSMQGNLQGATLVADDETYRGNNASELIWQITGWSIPVEHLPTWIKGQSLASDKVVLSQQGWVSQLQPRCLGCEGWLLTYSDYQLVGKHWLPHKIVLVQQQNQVQVIIKVNSWTIN